MLARIFKIFSYCLHPTLMPLLGVLILLSTTHLYLLPLSGKMAIIKIVAASTLILPLLLLPLLYYQKLITEITVTERNERLLPIFISIIFYFFGYYILYRLGAPSIVQYFILASFICVAIAGFLSFMFKISLHMIGIGGIIGLLSAISYLFQVSIDAMLMLSILFAGIIGSSRLYLKAHSHVQIYSGFTLGFVLTFIVMIGMISF